MGTRIDAHQHAPARLTWIGPVMQPLNHDWLPHDLAGPMAVNGIDAAIAVQAAVDETETALLMEQAKARARIAGVVGWVDLAAADAEARIAFWQHAGPPLGLWHQLDRLETFVIPPNP